MTTTSHDCCQGCHLNGCRNYPKWLHWRKTCRPPLCLCIPCGRALVFLAVQNSVTWTQCTKTRLTFNSGDERSRGRVRPYLPGEDHGSRGGDRLRSRGIRQGDSDRRADPAPYWDGTHEGVQAEEGTQSWHCQFVRFVIVFIICSSNFFPSGLKPDFLLELKAVLSQFYNNVISTWQRDSFGRFAVVSNKISCLFFIFETNFLNLCQTWVSIIFTTIRTIADEYLVWQSINKFPFSFPF